MNKEFDNHYITEYSFSRMELKFLNGHIKIHVESRDMESKSNQQKNKK